MKPNQIKGLALIAVVVIGVLVGGLLVFRTHFHQEFLGEDIERILIDIHSLEDTELTIGFSNTTGLCYSIDIATYTPSSSYGRFVVQPVQPGSESTRSLDIYFETRVKSMNITFRHDMSYRIEVVDGVNLNTEVVLSNNVSLDFALHYGSTGNISIYLAEDCFSTDLHWTEFRIGELTSPDVINLYADLPSGVEGTLYYASGAAFILLSSSGWSDQGSNIYSTFSSGYPERSVLFDLKATQKYTVWLSN